MVVDRKMFEIIDMKKNVRDFFFIKEMHKYFDMLRSITNIS